MKVAVIGPAGFSGSHICRELLTRGHTVTGLSRSPAKLGAHPSYTPIPLDINTTSIASLVPAFTGFDALIDAYNGANEYKDYLEATRKILLAAKAARVGYIIKIGGSGSLELPDGLPYETGADSREWWLAYRRANADSETATVHMQERFGGEVADFVRAYRDARVAIRAGKASEEQRKLVKETEREVLEGEGWIPDLPVAARAGLMMFEGDKGFRWTFVSPPAVYIPGPSTGKYEVWVDRMPMAKEAKTVSSDGNRFEGRILGISAGGLAEAIVDEVEKQEKVGKHWSAVAEYEDDVAYPTLVTI
ncbi:hypothetical protein LTR09_011634 [Extremus antarcticus]|uniref:NAD(P)-binding domain-containing protein n=1 Tax=Extremus antarcticus TaxID=702011 RepID=A0AAJ0DBX5_9PEZI|nr:hypothetical protein LTR09_011634 [Extremus antarcticus]